MAKRRRPINSLARLESLSGRQQQAYGRTLHAQRLMQNAGMSRREAAREAGTTPGTMDRYLGAALRKRGGRWLANASDGLYVTVLVPTTSGMRALPASPLERELTRRYRDALWRYDHFVDDSELLDLEGESISGYTLETDIARINEMIDRGELDPSEVGSGETARA